MSRTGYTYLNQKPPVSPVTDERDPRLKDAHIGTFIDFNTGGSQRQFHHRVLSSTLVGSL